jgi:hydrogenase maturation factor
MEQIQKFIASQYAGNRDMSLCIVKDTDQKEAEHIFTLSGYTLINNTKDIVETGKYVIVISPENIDSVYNLAAQYGSGQWSGLDDRWRTPDYTKLSVVGIINSEYLALLADKGQSLLSHVGMTIQL